MFANDTASLLFIENYHAEKHIIINQGGTSSGKTYAIMLALFYIASENKGMVITITGQDIPNLKAGVLRDALKIYNNSPALQRYVRAYNKSGYFFEFKNGTAKYTGANGEQGEFIVASI